MILSSTQINTIEEFIATNEPVEQPKIDMENAKRAYTNLQNEPSHTYYLIDYNRQLSTMYHIYKATDNSIYICMSHSTITSYNDYLIGYYKM
jgi:hypothetical protein